MPPTPFITKLTTQRNAGSVRRQTQHSVRLPHELVSDLPEPTYFEVRRRPNGTITLKPTNEQTSRLAQQGK